MATTFQAPPPEVIPVTTQTFYAGSTDHLISSAGQSSVGTIQVDSTNDFAVTAIVPSGYDENGSLFELGVKSDRFHIDMKTSTSGLHWQNKSYDLRHFIELLRAGRFPGMYLAKGATLEITISHSPSSPTATVLTKFPAVFECTLFGSKTNLKENPQFQEYQRQAMAQRR